MAENKYPGRLIITLTGPSGAGKDTLARALVQNDPRIKFFTTATTREPRATEKEGVDYYFLKEKEFLEKIENDEFLEYFAAFHGSMYGTLRAVIEGHFEQGEDVVSDINYPGVAQINQKMPANLLKICVLPPSYADLEQRLSERSKVSKEDQALLAKRLAPIKVDMNHLNEENYVFTNKDMLGSRLSDYDYVVVNDTLEEATRHALAAIEKERRKRS